LRLAYTPNIQGGPFTLKEKGYPQATIVCRQRSGHCQCLKGLEILEAQKRRTEVQAIQDTPRADEPAPEDTEEAEQPPEPEPEQPGPAAPTAAELQALVKQEKRFQKEYVKLAKEAQAQAIQAIADGMEADEPGAWLLIYSRLAMGQCWEDRPNDPVEIRKGIAQKIIEYHIQYQDPQDVPGRLANMLIEAGLRAPVF
jgi:hypothetical protein